MNRAKRILLTELLIIFFLIGGRPINLDYEPKKFEAINLIMDVA